MALGGRTVEEKILGNWSLPIRGVIQGIRDNDIPQDALYSGSNIEIISGSLRGRRGLTPETASLLGARPVGATNFWQNTTAGWVLVMTTAKIWSYELATDTLTDRGGSLTGTADDPGRFVQFAFGTPTTNRIYACNGINVLKTWKPGDASVSNVTGTPPIFRDLTIGGDRIVGIVGSHDIRWGEPLSDSVWPATNIRILSETPAPLVAIRNLGNIGIIAYKTDSLFIGELTGLAKGQSFRWTHLLWREGPASSNALVEADGIHIYMTRTGRVGLFNGASHKWVADGVWSIIKTEIDNTKPNRIHGHYLREENQVWFYYQRSGQSTTDGLLIVQLARTESGLPFAGFPGRLGKSITASCTMDDPTFTTSLVFASNSAAEKLYKITGIDDDGVAISSNLQHGFVPVPALESVRVLAIEPFTERASGYGELTVKAVTSNLLSDMAGTLSGGSIVDLTNTTKIKEQVGVDARGRFLAVRLEWTSAATIRYRGIILRAPQEG